MDLASAPSLLGFWLKDEDLENDDGLKSEKFSEVQRRSEFGVPFGVRTTDTSHWLVVCASVFSERTKFWAKMNQRKTKNLTMYI